jgi:hypothetical protein
MMAERMNWRALIVASAILGGASSAPAAEMPLGIFRGTLVAIEGSASAGRLNAEDTTGSEYSCGYDSRSYFELDKSRIKATDLQKGDPLEVIADHKPGSRTCYARIVHTHSSMSSQLRRAAAQPRAIRNSDFLPPRGDRTFAGIVLGRQGSLLLLRTREGQQVLRLRPDTRFLANGVRLEAADLPINRHVFVRAGENAWGEVEAYQVMWGDMVKQP